MASPEGTIAPQSLSLVQLKRGECGGRGKGGIGSELPFRYGAEKKKRRGRDLKPESSYFRSQMHV